MYKTLDNKSEQNNATLHTLRVTFPPNQFMIYFLDFFLTFYRFSPPNFPFSRFLYILSPSRCVDSLQERLAKWMIVLHAINIIEKLLQEFTSALYTHERSFFLRMSIKYVGQRHDIALESHF